MKYLLCAILLCGSLHADDQISKGHKLLYTNLAAVSLVAGWGVLQWDYGQRTMHTTEERWFTGDTPYGGADKLGHFYFTYAAGRGFSALYEAYGYNPKEASLYGALSSLLVNGMMEVGDAFSDYGFAYEDFLMNIAGSCTAYLFERCQRCDEMFDIRLEYLPSSDIRHGRSTDIVTDYEGMKFLTAYKLSSSDLFNDTPAQYLELHLGYYTRHNGSGNLERSTYIGLGLNLSRLFDSDHQALNALFEYYQPPYTYLQYAHEE